MTILLIKMDSKLLFNELYKYSTDKNVINIILNDYLDVNLKYARDKHKISMKNLNKEYYTNFKIAMDGHDEYIMHKEGCTLNDRQIGSIEYSFEFGSIINIITGEFYKLPLNYQYSN